MSSQASVICFALSIILQMNSSPSFEHSMAFLTQNSEFFLQSSQKCMVMSTPAVLSDLIAISVLALVLLWESPWLKVIWRWKCLFQLTTLSSHSITEGSQGRNLEPELKPPRNCLLACSSWVAQLRCMLEPPTSIINQENVLQTAYRESGWRCALSWGFSLQITLACVKLKT